jgi:hypothetical protein
MTPQERISSESIPEIDTNSANIAKEVSDIHRAVDGQYKSEINFAACRCSVGLFVESSTRKVNITKATELCPQHDIKSQNHFTIEEKSSRRGWRQWLQEVYGKGVFRLD